MKKFLVIESHAIDKDDKRHDFIHFIDLSKDGIESDISSLFHHITWFCGKEGQQVDKVYFSDTRLTNW